MRRTLVNTGLIVAALLTAPVALADGMPLTLRIDPGVAVPMTSPQTDRFKVGGDIALKPTLGLTPWFDVNLTFGGMALPSKLNNTDYGQVMSAGAGARVKRPHDESNTGVGLSAVSPWVDGDARYVRTGPLDRFAWSLAVGAAVPTGKDRTVWVGPFVRYLDIVDSVNGKPMIDNTDAHVFIVGLGFEFGAPVKQKVEPCPPPPEAKESPSVQPKKVEKKEEPRPLPVARPIEVSIKEKVQFPYDSAKPLPESTAALARVLAVMADHPGWHVEIDGHASSEGRVAHNEKLSVKRAQSVKDFLTKNGIPADHLSVKGFGSRQPIADNSTEDGRKKNRRVEFSIDITLTQGNSK